MRRPLLGGTDVVGVRQGGDRVWRLFGGRTDVIDVCLMPVTVHTVHNTPPCV
jgi:hypothetical protein